MELRDVESWNLAIGELDKGVVTLQVGGEMKTCSAPKPLDHDGTDISLKDWELGSRNSVEMEPTVGYSLKSLKGTSVRTKFTPVEPSVDEEHSPRHFSSLDRVDTAPTTPRTPRGSGTRSGSVSPTRLERKSVQQLVVDRGSASHHLDNVYDFSADASSRTLRTGSIKGNLNSSSLNHISNLRTRSERGMALHVSFEGESDVDKGLGTSGRRYRSPSKCRMTRPPWNDEIVEHPNWESPKKIRPQSTSMPKTHNVHPTLHGTSSRSTVHNNSALRVRSSSLLIPEIATENQSNGMPARRSRASEVRTSLSLQTIGERSRFHDASSSFTSSSSVSGSFQYRSESTEPTSKPDSPSFLLRCNAKREYNDVKDEESGDEDVKVGMVCGGGLVDTDISDDPVRLLGKMCGVPLLLSKQPVTKSSSQQMGRKLNRSNTTAGSWETPDAEMRENFANLGRHASLKLLSERCFYGPYPPYNVHKVPRKIRDHEPHQHFYKPISKSLDQLLRS
ncbi:uncharacterized protein [Physcomitrium patens]